MDAEFLIHVTQRYDQSVICMKRPKLIEAIKFLYWRSTGMNIPVNVIPIKDKATYMTTKQLSVKKIFNEIPEEFRQYD